MGMYIFYMFKGTHTYLLQAVTYCVNAEINFPTLNFQQKSLAIREVPQAQF